MNDREIRDERRRRNHTFDATDGKQPAAARRIRIIRHASATGIDHLKRAMPSRVCC